MPLLSSGPHKTREINTSLTFPPHPSSNENAPLCRDSVTAPSWHPAIGKSTRGAGLRVLVDIQCGDYQMMARSLGSSHILSPALMPKASKKVSMFLSVAFTR